ncbi:MAG: DUF1659 domain-containing protein [Tissierellia bacterium]|nr:DUF1659 domain-containing protein [Tissierellia bacterium]
MAIRTIKENTRLKLELDGGMDGDKQIIKSKTFSRVKPEADNEDLYQVALSLGGLQALPVEKIKRLEEVQLLEE